MGRKSRNLGKGVAGGGRDYRGAGGSAMKAWKDMMKKENLVVLLILGLLLLVLALPTEKTDRQNAKKEVETAQTGTAENWQQEMERQLQEILEQVEGVGETRVFLTCQSSSRKIVEKDETETVYEKDAKGTQQPYVASEEYPRVTGVLIVAKGGGNPVVVGNIQAAVEALFQVEPHKIKVMKMN